jgi:CHAT domain-containing protein/tetratricopeptide (TPR) repeat protein
MSEEMVQIERLMKQVARLRQEGRYEQALTMARETCELARRGAGTQHPLFAACLKGMALLYREVGDYEAADEVYQQALEVHRTVLGEDHPDTALVLGDYGGLLQAKGNLGGARACFEQALAIRRQTLGDGHPDTILGFYTLGALLREMGNLSEARPWFEQAVTSGRLTLGENHPITAFLLNDLGALLQSLGDLNGALPCYEQALAIRQATLGEGHPDTAKSLHNLGGLLRLTRDLPRARSCLEGALMVFRTTLGPDHPDTITSLNTLADLLVHMGNFSEAQAAYERALEVRRRVLGPEHPKTVHTLYDLANLHFIARKFDSAEQLLHEVITIERQNRGETMELIIAQKKMGELYLQKGDLARAMETFLSVQAIARRVLGARDLNYGVVVSNLGIMAMSLHDYTRAVQLYKEALGIARANLPPEHPQVYTELNNLGMAYFLDGNYTQAEQLIDEAFNIASASPSPEGAVQMAKSANVLALLVDSRGQHEEADKLWHLALELRRRTEGQDSAFYAGGLLNLAQRYARRGEHAEAEEMVVRASAILRENLGEKHPVVAGSLCSLADLYAAAGRVDRALVLMEQVRDIMDFVLDNAFSFGPDRQRLDFLDAARADLDRYLALVVGRREQTRAEVRKAYDWLLRRKALGADASSARQDAVLGGRRPELVPKLHELAEMRMQIARLALAGPSAESMEAHGQRLMHLAAVREHLEGELARQIPEMRLGQLLSAADSEAVALALPAGAGLVEFVRFDVFDFQAVPARGEKRWKPRRYLAFVFASGDPDKIRMIDLGWAEPIDQLVAAFRSGVTGQAELRDLTRVLPQTLPAPDPNPGERLRAAVFDPLAAALGCCRRLFLAPDGDLIRLPFEALPLEDGRHLLDTYSISYVTVGRDLLRFQARSDRRPAAPLVAADPDFDLRAESDAAPPESTAAPVPRPGFWSRLFGRGRTTTAAQSVPQVTVRHTPAAPSFSLLSRDLDRSHCHFRRLPGTRVEGERVADRLGVQPLLADSALEGCLKSCRSPRILHLATHGFFLPDPERDLNRLDRNLELRGAGDLATMSGPLRGPGMENPMLRSGLALAGANTFLSGNAIPNEAEDGLLTAEDVIGLDLLDTELVVLSACETGLGALHAGEGVFGLRRAFVVAGAKTLVMSLWKVPDLATAFLMDRLYDNLLARSLNRDLALREAQRATRDVTVGQLRTDWLSGTMIECLAAGDAEATRALRELAGQPDDHRPFEQPFYWGAFICQGDTAPLPTMDKAPG